MFGFNWLDLVLIAALGVGMAIGYVQGLLRQVIGLAVMYLAAILAAQYFRVIADFLRNMFLTTPGTLLNLVSFFIILFAVMALLNFLASDAYRMTRLRLMPWLDHLGGMLIGLFSIWILATIAVNMVEYATGASSWATGEELRQVLASGLFGSQMVDVTHATMPTILTAIKPWLPTGVPALFHF